ncbi:MAG: SDR family oxidoreductase [Solirubrobacterales bacterium]|nr:SDR family oxidoreductase [Solirubrobacterales bacterium]MCB0860335.1 SDR family oxidoreductase [Solirubrobacterales bacterium]
MGLLTRNRPRPLAGQTVAITGAASGIGRALAIRLSGMGCPVAIADKNEEGLAETETMIQGPVLTKGLDVKDRAAQFVFASEVKDWAPAPIGAVFNNAGVALSTTVAESSPEDEEWLLQINFEGVVNGTHAFLPILLDQGFGAIVNTSSVFGLAGVRGQSAYCASKFAVRGFTEALRQELAGTGLRAITIHPGGVKTGIARSARVHMDPTGRGRSPETMASDFEAIARTTPEKAAEIIQQGVDSGKVRILVGPDAYIFDLATRISPSGYHHVINALERYVHSKIERT